MPTLAAPNLDTMRPPGNPDDFVDLGWRPVFKQHINRAGQFVGENELAGITDCCNERVLDTGDFAALVVGHTTDDEVPGQREVVGFAGPYRMGKIGTRKPLPAIEARIWAYKKKVDRLKDFPRLSVEFWQKPDDPSHGYFDPICLLGSETPELDLGLHYAKGKHSGMQMMRYSRSEQFTVGKYSASPGGGNTFVPGMIGDDDSDDKKQPYSKESASMATLTPADIQQIVAAMVPIVTQQVSEAMQGMKGQAGGDDLGMGADGDLDGDGDADLDLDGDSDLDVGDDLDGMDDDADGDADSLGDDDETDIDENGDDADLDEGDDDAPDISDEDSDLGLGDDSDLEDPDEPLDDGDVADDDDSDLEASGKDKDKGKMSDADKKPDDKKKPVKFSKVPVPGMTVEQYAKENGELHERYHKAELRAVAAENKMATLEERIASIENEKKVLARYSKLNELAAVYAFDVEEEMKDTESYNDEQFARHCTKITRYAKAPIGHGIYVPPSGKRDGSGPDEKRERYAKVAGETAKSLVAAGKPVDYAAIRANVERNDGVYKPDAA